MILVAAHNHRSGVEASTHSPPSRGTSNSSCHPRLAVWAARVCSAWRAACCVVASGCLTTALATFLACGQKVVQPPDTWTSRHCGRIFSSLPTLRRQLILPSLQCVTSPNAFMTCSEIGRWGNVRQNTIQYNTCLFSTNVYNLHTAGEQK